MQQFDKPSLKFATVQKYDRIFKFLKFFMILL